MLTLVTQARTAQDQQLIIASLRVLGAAASFQQETLLVDFDDSILSQDDIVQCIKDCGFGTSMPKRRNHSPVRELYCTIFITGMDKVWTLNKV
jgi:hypothetical protein